MKRLLLLTLLLLPATGASGDDVLRHPARSQLSAATATEGRLLTAWKSVDSDWSEIRVVENGKVVQAWELPGLRVQDARWVVPGKKLLVVAVEGADPVNRLYVAEPGGVLRPDWSDEELRNRYAVVTVNEDGTLWMGSSFDADRAVVEVGRVGRDQPMQRWQVTAGEPPAPLALDQFSQAFFRSDTPEPLDVGILWGARLWLVGPATPEPRRVAFDCPAVHGAHPTRDGLWVECYLGLEAEPSRRYTLYSSKTGDGGALPTAALSVELNDPVFLFDGTVVEPFSKKGQAEVYTLRRDAEGLEPLGSFAFPPRARLFFAGDSVLVETPAGEEFEVRPLVPASPKPGG